VGSVEHAFWSQSAHNLVLSSSVDLKRMFLREDSDTPYAKLSASYGKETMEGI
jgi:hypothetical protein